MCTSFIKVTDDNPRSCYRYNTANQLLSTTDNMNVEKAFDILKVVKQSEGVWITDFSMVYDKSKRIVYYCSNQEFDNIKEYHFQ